MSKAKRKCEIHESFAFVLLDFHKYACSKPFSALGLVFCRTTGLPRVCGAGTDDLRDGWFQRDGVLQQLPQVQPRHDDVVRGTANEQ